MSDSPKHPADPANELASDNSAIDPRDFRNALSTFATGVTIVTAMAADGTPYGVTCNSFASVSLNPPLVLWSLGMFSQGLTIFQNASHFTVNVLGASQQALAAQFAKSSIDKFAGVNWTPGSATHRCSPTASPIFSVVPPIVIMVATMLLSWGLWRLMPTIGKSRCCLRKAASAGSSRTTAKSRRNRGTSIRVEADVLVSISSEICGS